MILSPTVQSHLVKVYTALAATSGTAAVGAHLQMKQYIQWNEFLSALLGMFLLSAVLFLLPKTKQNQTTRLACLLGFGFCEGVSVTPLLSLAVNLNMGHVVVQALVSTTLIFASFSIGALMARRGSMLYIGGLLMSVLSVMMWMSFFNIFIGSRSVMNAELYLGLVVFAGFVVYDTQLIVEKCLRGDVDFLSHSAELFVDVFGVFVRLLVILMKKEEQKQRRRRKDD